MTGLTHPSPNAGPRCGGAFPDMVVLHYTGMESTEAAVARLADPAAEVSAHYVIDPGGAVLSMVEEAERAWHAGRSSWGGITDVNSHSIGIEIVNPGHDLGYPPFPEPQMRALETLLGGILGRHGIPPERVVGHACIAPLRKRDPGEKFDWRRLALGGMAVWRDPDGPVLSDPVAPAPEVADRFWAAAARLGYGVSSSAMWDDGAEAVWQAFAGRFLPALAGMPGPPPSAAVRHLEDLARRWPVRASS